MNPRGILSSLPALLLAALLLTAGGCRTPYEAFPEEHPEAWTASEIELMLGGDDPLEGFNRAMFCCTDFLMSYVADPLGRVYTTILPRPFIHHFNNVCVNLEYPARAVSSLIQAEWGAAGTETVRFLANSTLGIAGIFDVAQSWWEIPQAEADFGQAFAAWGIPPGATFMVPVAPTLNGRDLVGLIFDTAFDLKTYIPYAGYATFLNRMVVMQAGYAGVVDNAADPYRNYRQLMLLRRELQLRMWFYRELRRRTALAKEAAEAAEKREDGTPVPPPPPVLPPPPPRPKSLPRGRYMPLANFAGQGSEKDSLRVLLCQVQRDNDWWYMPLSLFNGDFRRAGRTRSVEIAVGRPKLRYGYWEAPEAEGPRRERLVVMLPGIGGNYVENTMLAIAEQFHLAGFKVLTLDSSFNWRFAVTDGELRLPGYLPEDAARVRVAVASALADIRDREWISSPEIVLCGYSMGGIQTLKIADLEERSPMLGISRFIAVNPPVSLKTAMDRFDALVAASAGWSKSEMRERLVAASGELVLKLAGHYPHLADGAPAEKAAEYQLPTDPESAKVIAGILMKISLREMLFAVHRERPLPGYPEYRWGSRGELYRVLDELTLDRYARELVWPQHPDKDLDALMDESTLFPMEATLRNSGKVRVFHTIDDFLVTPGERVWLDEVLGDRLTWLSNGGHLGSLYYQSVLDAIVAASAE